jgi:hypothetical protein
VGILHTHHPVTSTTHEPILLKKEKEGKKKKNKIERKERGKRKENSTY